MHQSVTQKAKRNLLSYTDGFPQVGDAMFEAVKLQMEMVTKRAELEVHPRLVASAA